MTHMANHFYYCAKITFDIVDFNVDNNVFGNAQNARIAPF